MVDEGVNRKGGRGGKRVLLRRGKRERAKNPRSLSFVPS
jgi:hypothetical protein